MGKNTAINRKKKLAKQRRKQAAKLDDESLSIEELLAKAQENIDSFEYESAQKYCQEALKREPDNVLALETSASLCLEVGNFDGAKHCLGRAITLQPEEGHEKYMSMGQLLSGKESLQCYQKGAEIIIRVINIQPDIKSQDTKKDGEGTDVEMGADQTPDSTRVQDSKSDPGISGQNKENAGGSENEQEPCEPSSSLACSDASGVSLVRQLSTALCSVAELYMTDLCDEAEAEEQCRAAINAAIEADPTSPEAYQHMASFLLVKQEMDEAKWYINKSLELWLPGYKSVEEGKAAAGSFDPVQVCPLAYPARLAAARILIEVEDYQHAVEVLEGLTEENDEVVDTWYLLGWTYYQQGEEHQEAAKYHLHRAQQVHASTPSDDQQLVEHLQELAEEVGPYMEDDTPAPEDIEKELESNSEDEDEETMDMT